MRCVVASALFLLILPGSTLAQGPHVELGAALAATSSNQLPMTGFEVYAGLQIPGHVPSYRVTARAVYSRVKGRGSPLQCQIARPAYCLGRSEQAEHIGMAVGGQVFAELRENLNFVWRVIDIGLLHGSRQSTESEGPTGLCVIDGQIVSCPDNPPFTQFAAASDGFGLEIATGIGLELAGGHARYSLELRFARSWSDALLPQRVLLTAGVSF